MVNRIVFVVMLGIVVALGQTSADLKKKYGQVISYELRPGIVMTPRYAESGMVCEMVLERRLQTGTGIMFADAFSEKEVKQLVDELAPESARGRNLTQPLNITVDGGFITTEYKYENILVRVYGTTRPAPGGDRVIKITWPKRACIETRAAAVPQSADRR